MFHTRNPKKIQQQLPQMDLKTAKENQWIEKLSSTMVRKKATKKEGYLLKSFFSLLFNYFNKAK